MHRTYSMRQSRAPTASQIQNPPPPSSSTKSRLFGKNNFSKSIHSIVTQKHEGHALTVLRVYQPINSVNPSTLAPSARISRRSCPSW
jgi:hypothetical protein